MSGNKVIFVGNLIGLKLGSKLYIYIMNARVKKRLKSEEDIGTLIEIGKEAGRNAIRSSKALGLSITYLKDGKVIEEFPDGKQVVIKEIEDKTTTSIQLKKGMVFYAKD